MSDPRAIKVALECVAMSIRHASDSVTEGQKEAFMEGMHQVMGASLAAVEKHFPEALEGDSADWWKKV